MATRAPSRSQPLRTRSHAEPPAAVKKALDDAASDTACGFGAGLCEAALAQTPNQAISTKMLHDASPAGSQRYRSFVHATRSIYAEHGFWRGFFCGLEPAVLALRAALMAWYRPGT